MGNRSLKSEPNIYPEIASFQTLSTFWVGKLRLGELAEGGCQSSGHQERSEGLCIHKQVTKQPGPVGASVPCRYLCTRGAQLQALGSEGSVGVVSNA